MGLISHIAYPSTRHEYGCQSVTLLAFDQSEATSKQTINSTWYKTDNNAQKGAWFLLKQDERLNSDRRGGVVTRKGVGPGGCRQRMFAAFDQAGR